MTNSKRGKRGSSSSSVSSNTEFKKARMNQEEEETNSLRDLIQNLTANMDSNFAKLHEELYRLRQEMKEEMDMLKSNINGVRKSVDEIWTTIEDMKEATKALKDSKTVQEDEMQELRALLTKTKAELKEERDKVIELEDYTRRENLKFHNIPESEKEGVNHSPKQVILSILQKELQMDTAQIRFHAVHRIGKRKENKHRPIIARFVCREDRDQVFARKKGIKESTRFKDAYITADYAKAIQDERRKLIKAMFKAKEQGSETKVVGRYLYIGELKYDVTNIPEDFK